MSKILMAEMKVKENKINWTNAIHQ